MKPPYLSIVVPVFNSANSLDELLSRIRTFCTNEGVSFEIIAVNDGSSDRSYEVLRKLTTTFPELIAVDLEHNFGQQAATLCGLIESTGNYVVTIDDDLEYRPEDIHTLLFAIEKTNIQLIYGFSPKEGKPRWYNPLAVIGKKMIYGFSGLPLQLSSFRLIRQECLQELSVDNSRYFLVDSLIRKKIRPHNFIKVKQDSRKYGVSNYNFKKLVAVWIRFLFSSSYFGELTSIISTLLGLFFLVREFELAAWGFILLSLVMLYGVFAIKWRRTPAYRIKEKVSHEG